MFVKREEDWCFKRRSYKLTLQLLWIMLYEYYRFLHAGLGQVALVMSGGYEVDDVPLVFRKSFIVYHYPNWSAKSEKCLQSSLRLWNENHFHDKSFIQTSQRLFQFPNRISLPSRWFLNKYSKTVYFNVFPKGLHCVPSIRKSSFATFSAMTDPFFLGVICSQFSMVFEWPICLADPFKMHKELHQPIQGN